MSKKFQLQVLLQMAFITYFVSAQNDSGLKTASFGVFSNSYDYSTDIQYWDETGAQQPACFTGIHNNHLNIGISGLLHNIYSSLSFNEQITNYKAWPNNMTDETVSLLVGFPGKWGLKIQYFDFCYSEGKGTAMPSLATGKNFTMGNGTLRLAVNCSLACRYSSSNDMNLIQPSTTIMADYGENADNGFGISYQLMPTCAGSYNTIDVSGIPFYHKLSGWFGRTWDIDNNLSIGIHPNFYTTVNAINSTKQLYNDVPENGNLEFLARIPFSFRIVPQNDNIEYIMALMVGLYYANFDHPGSNGPGGNNNSGWVPETGVGIGIYVHINKNCQIQLGSQFIRIPELTENNDENQYTAKDISISSLLDSPLSISTRLTF